MAILETTGDVVLDFLRCLGLSPLACTDGPPLEIKSDDIVLDASTLVDYDVDISSRWPSSKPPSSSK
jgi:hypothetical protein